MSKSDNRPGGAVSIPKDWAQFCAFIETHYGVMYSMALAHVRDGEVAQEIAQDVCVRLLLERDTLPPLTNAGGWLARVARNTAIDWVRRRQTHSRILAKMEAMNYNPGGRNTPPEDARTGAIGEEERRRLFDALDHVVPETREMLLLHLCDGIEKQEIARLMEVHPSTVGRRVAEGLRTLRKILDADDMADLASARLTTHTARGIIATLGLVAGMSAADKAALAALAAVAAPLPALGAGAIIQPSATSLITLVKNTDWSSLVKSKGFMISSAVVGAAIITGVLIERNSNADSADMERTEISTPATVIHMQDNLIGVTAPPIASTSERGFELASEGERLQNSISTSTLTCRLLNDEGKPIPEEDVRYYIVLPPIPGKVNRYGKPVHPPVRQGNLKTDQYGQFELSGIGHSDQILLTVAREGFAQYNELAGPPYTQKDIYLKRPYTQLSGIVRNLLTSAPVTNAVVTVTPTQEMAYGTKEEPEIRDIVGEQIRLLTDSAGQFETDLLPAGKLLLDAITEDGLRMVPQTDGVYKSLTLYADTPLSIPDVMVYKGYTLTGVVRDSITSQPIRGATLGFSGSGIMLGGSIDEPVKTNEEGRYQITGVNPYPLKTGGFRFSRFYASMPGYKQKIQEPFFDHFDINHLTINQDFLLSPDETTRSGHPDSSALTTPR